MIARKVYRLLLYLHPPSFRERFACEMLWLFDQTAGTEGVFSLLTDGMMSLLTQHLATDAAPRRAGDLFQQTPTDSLSVIRFAQASGVALPLVFAFLLLLQQSVPLPEPAREVSVRRYVPAVCGEVVIAAHSAEHHHLVHVAHPLTRLRP